MNFVLIKIFLILFFSQTIVRAQQINYQWVKKAGSSNTDVAFGVTTDAAGNIYTTGYFSNTVDFDPGPGVFNLTATSGPDIFILKQDPSGNFLWVKKFAGTGVEAALSIALDAAGNIYTTGYIWTGTTDFDPGAGVFSLNASSSLADIFISKLDASGNFVWAKVISTAGEETGNAIKLDAAGNVYVVGYFNGIVDFDPGAATFNLTSSGGEDGFLLKMDAAGNFIGAINIGAVGSDIARSLALDAAGNIYIAGFFHSTVDFDPGAAVFTLTAAANDANAFVLKLDNNGLFVWAKNWVYEAYGVAVDNSGNVYTTSSYGGTSDFDPGPGVYNLTTAGATDILVTKLDMAGNFIWAKSIGGAANDYPSQIEVDPTGNSYVTGVFRGTSDFDPSASTYTLASAGQDDIFINKLDASGNYNWAVRMGGISNDKGNAITLNNLGNVIVVGKFQSLNADFDPGAGTFNLSTAGNEDIFIEKFCEIQTPVITAGGPTTFCLGGSVTLSSSAALGYLWSTGATTQSISVSTSGNYNVVVTSTTGCTASSASMAVTVNPLPTITVNSGSVCLGNSFTIQPTGAFTYTISGGSAIVSPSVSTSYSVSGTSAFGCVSATNAVSDITVSSVPLPTITVNSGSICAGNSFTLSPSGANTYTFSSGSAIVSPPVTTNYSVTGSNLSGCKSASPAVVTITVLPAPVISVNGGTICSGQSFTLLPAGAASYTFSGGNAIITPTVTTAYSVTGTSSTGCVSLLPIVANVVVNALPIIGVNSGSLCSGQSFTLVPTGAASYTFFGGGPVLTPTASSNYSVAGTNSLGCVSDFPAIASITVFSVPVIFVNSGAICSGNSFTINPTGAATYTFSSGTPVVSPATNSSYFVSGTSAAGCVSTVQGVSNVTVNALPQISIMSNDSTICFGEMATLSTLGPFTFTWSTGSNTSFINVSPTVTTVYTLTASDNNNCKGMAVFVQEVNLCLGVKDNITAGSDITVYPNPNCGSFFINNTSPDFAQILIYDQLGRNIFALQLLSGINTLQPDLAKGMYYYTIILKDTIKKGILITE